MLKEMSDCSAGWNSRTRRVNARTGRLLVQTDLAEVGQRRSRAGAERAVRGLRRTDGLVLRRHLVDQRPRIAVEQVVAGERDAPELRHRFLRRAWTAAAVVVL